MPPLQPRAGQNQVIIGPLSSTYGLKSLRSLWSNAELLSILVYEGSSGSLPLGRSF